MFCAAMRIADLALRSAVTVSDVYGGQITMSTDSRSFDASGRNESMNAAASGRVLCIFQLAAQIGFRDGIGSACLLPAAHGLGVEQRLDPGQLAALQEVERCATSGR